MTLTVTLDTTDPEEIDRLIAAIELLRGVETVTETPLPERLPPAPLDEPTMKARIRRALS